MKSWTKTILDIGISCSLLGAALAGYGFVTGGLSDLEHSTAMIGNVNYQKASLDSFSKIDIDSTTSDVIISKANIDKSFISYSDNKNILRLVVKKSPTGESTHYFFFMIK